MTSAANYLPKAKLAAPRRPSSTTRNRPGDPGPSGGHPLQIQLGRAEEERDEAQREVSLLRHELSEASADVERARDVLCIAESLVTEYDLDRGEWPREIVGHWVTLLRDALRKDDE